VKKVLFQGRGLKRKSYFETKETCAMYVSRMLGIIQNIVDGKAARKGQGK
jgi:hypothetical protein